LLSDDNAERRKQIIEESKYLGGDLEHTHLVKGLDYALLQKIKAELETQKSEENIEKNEEDDADEADEDDDDDDEEGDHLIEDNSSKTKIKQNLASK
jgi:IK cytokine